MELLSQLSYRADKLGSLAHGEFILLTKLSGNIPLGRPAQGQFTQVVKLKH